MSSSQSIMEAFEHIQSNLNSVEQGKREEHFGNLYPELQTQFPFLFHKICTDPHMDLSKLEYMLQMRDAMKEGQNGLDTQEAARQVGQTMFDTFVKPMLDAKEAEEGKH